MKNAKKASKGGAGKAEYEKCKKTLERLLEQLDKLEIQKTDKDENKTIALGTSKLNYLDPRYVIISTFGIRVESEFACFLSYRLWVI